MRGRRHGRAWGQSPRAVYIPQWGSPFPGACVYSSVGLFSGEFTLLRCGESSQRILHSPAWASPLQSAQSQLWEVSMGKVGVGTLPSRSCMYGSTFIHSGSKSKLLVQTRVHSSVGLLSDEWAILDVTSHWGSVSNPLRVSRQESEFSSAGSPGTEFLYYPGAVGLTIGEWAFPTGVYTTRRELGSVHSPAGLVHSTIELLLFCQHTLLEVSFPAWNQCLCFKSRCPARGCTDVLTYHGGHRHPKRLASVLR